MSRDLAQQKCNAINITTSHDAHEHAHNLRDWQQHYDQISAGEFNGEIIERSFHDLQVFKEHTSQALSQSCLVWPESIWLGITPIGQISSTKSKINGLALSQQDIMCRPGDVEFELTTPDNFDIYGIVVTQTKLTTQADKQGI